MYSKAFPHTGQRRTTPGTWVKVIRSPHIYNFDLMSRRLADVLPIGIDGWLQYDLGQFKHLDDEIGGRIGMGDYG